MNIQILSFRHALYTFKRYLVCLQIGWVEFLLFPLLIILKLLALLSQAIHLILDKICVFCSIFYDHILFIKITIFCLV